VVLDMTVRREHQRLGGASIGQLGQVLAGQVVQPAEPVRARDRDDAAVAPVNPADLLGQRALFPQRIAVM
jgi:hypothetical protein